MIDVIEQEATRDIYAAGAVQLGDEDDYFQSGLFTIARRRILWLLILVLANGLTTKVIAMNDQILKEIVLLAAFIPLLIGTGGNVGAQSSTVVIRGLSTQKLKSMGAFKVVFKEAITGALLGILMIRRPPRSTPLYSSAASDVYKRQKVVYLQLLEGEFYGY